MSFLTRLFGLKSEGPVKEFSNEIGQIDDILLTPEDFSLKKDPPLELGTETSQLPTLNPRTIKDVWLPIHAERTIVLTGRLRRTVNTEDQNWLTMNDGTANILIDFTDRPMPILGDLSDIFEIRGQCVSNDGVSPHLIPYNVVLLNSTQPPVVSEVPMRRQRDPMNLLQDDSVPEVRGLTGANWTRRFDGPGVRSDSNWQKLRAEVFRRDVYKCVECGSLENLTVDHIQPLSLGGGNELINLRTLCADCHESRHNKHFLDERFTGDDNYGERHQLTNKVQRITGAIERHERLSVVYVNDQGVKTRRHIYPIRVRKGQFYRGKIVAHSTIFVDAYCELRGENRTFRLSRMKDIVLD